VKRSSSAPSVTGSGRLRPSMCVPPDAPHLVYRASNQLLPHANSDRNRRNSVQGFFEISCGPNVREPDASEGNPYVSERQDSTEAA
jgi:hypothetical protein